jgi:hypothetical protein
MTENERLIDEICWDIKAVVFKKAMERKLDGFIRESESVMDAYVKMKKFLAWLIVEARAIDSFSLFPFGEKDRTWFRVYILIRHTNVCGEERSTLITKIIE